MIQLGPVPFCTFFPSARNFYQLRILLIGDVGNDLLPGAGHPAGLGVGGSAAGEYQDADIGPSHGVIIALESGW